MTASTYSTPGHLEVQQPARSPFAFGIVRTGLRVLVAGVAIALVVLGWPLQVGATLVLGVAVLLYALASMAREAPVDRG